MKIFVSWIYNLSAIQNVIHSKNSFKMVFADYQGRKTTMSHYHHLGTTERKIILRMHVEGKNVWAKNHVLERTASIINSELRWNGGKKRSYSPSEAEWRNGRSRKHCHKKTLFCSLAAKALVQHLFLDEQWSPEQIENRLNKEDNPIQEGFSTIYRGIYARILESTKLSKG